MSNHAHRPEDDVRLTWREFFADLLVLIGIGIVLYAALLILPGLES